MAKRIIKPDSGNTLVLQEDNGSIDALTVETNGDVTLAGNFTSKGIDDNASSTALTIDASGNVGIGGSPSETLTVAQGTTERAIAVCSSDANVGGFIGATGEAGSANKLVINASRGSGAIIFQTISTERMRIDNSGNVNILGLSASSDVQTDASKNLITTSDARLKNDLGVITDSAINVVQQIIPKYFSWKNDESNSQQLGFFAQDIYPVLPEAAPRALKYIEVGKDENDKPILEPVLDEEGNPDYEWGFTDRPIIAMCVKAIQEQQALIESQQSQIDALVARIETLENAAG